MQAEAGKVQSVQQSSTRSAWLGAVWAAPAVCLVAVFFVYPFIRSLLTSFRSTDGAWTWKQYLSVWKLYAGDFWFTIGVSAISLFALLVITVLLGGLLRLQARPFVEFLFKIPLFVPFVVVGHAMRVFLAPHGTLNSGLMALHVFDPDHVPSIAFTTLGLIFALVWKNIGFSLLLVLGSYRSVNDNYLDAARNMGAGRVRLILDILMPMGKGSLGVVAVLTFTSMMGSFSIPAMLGDGGGHQMLMVDLYYQLIYQQNTGAANALGVIAYLASMGAAIYYMRRISSL